MGVVLSEDEGAGVLDDLGDFGGRASFHSASVKLNIHVLFVVKRDELLVSIWAEVLVELLAEPLVCSASGVCIPLLAGLSDLHGFVLDGRQVVQTLSLVGTDG